MSNFIFVYSASKDCFYHLIDRAHFQRDGIWPDDTIDAPSDVVEEFLQPRQGYRRVAGPDGLPRWEAMTDGSGTTRSVVRAATS